MAEEELNLDLDSDDEQQKDANRAEQRLRNLNSEKAKLVADNGELAKGKELAEAEKAAALKDVDFYKNFSTVSSKYTGASEYQDKIKEKVSAGYSVEDATISTLVAEGKFTPPVAPPEPRNSPAGGSASNTIKSSAKPLAEMTQAERRAELMEAERRGDISLS